MAIERIVDTSVNDDGSEEQIIEVTLRPQNFSEYIGCLLYTSPSPRDRTRSRMPSSA